MFTGLVETVGRIERLDGNEHGKQLVISTRLGAELRPGDSVAVSGVCLTVVARDDHGFCADVSRETLAVTTLGGQREGAPVNLERPLRADARLGGHFVLGHVDQVGTIAALRPDGDGYWLSVRVPGHLAPYLIPKGSIAIDGISLTIAALEEENVGVQIVPFTYTHTALAASTAGDSVNIEVDVLGKYVVRLLSMGQTAGVVAPAGL